MVKLATRVPLRRVGAIAAAAVGVAVLSSGACSPGGTYTRTSEGSNDAGNAGDSAGHGGEGGVVPTGAGGAGNGQVVASGGAPGGSAAGLPTAGRGGQHAPGAGGTGTGGTTIAGAGGVLAFATGGALGSGGGLATGGTPAIGASGGMPAGAGGIATGGTTGAGSGNGSGGVPGIGGGAAGGGTIGGSGGSGGAAQAILSIDFVGAVVSSGGTGGKTVTPAPMAPTEVAGVKRASNWNEAGTNTGTLTPLVLADGTSTTATVTWNAPMVSTSFGVYSAGLADAPGDVRMMNGYLDPTSSGSTPSVTVTVSGLPTSITAGGYDVYVYFLGTVPSGLTRSQRLAIGTTSFTVSQTGPAMFSGYVLSPNMGTGNYVVFRQVTGSSFTLTGTPTSGVTLRAPMNGLQIVWPTGS